MATESILLISRNTRNAHKVLETHPERLSRRAIVDDVEIAMYENESIRARGGIEYADPLGMHPRITDAIHAEVEKQRALSFNNTSHAVSFERQLTRTQRPSRDQRGGPTVMSGFSR